MQANNKIDGFKVPDKYFENLASNIENSVFLNELKSTKATNSFLIPENYFNNLETTLNKISETKNPKIISLIPIKYAAAACILLFCALAIYLNINTYNVQQQLASIPNSDLEFYLQNNTNNSDMQTLIQNVEYMETDIDEQISTKEINDYLNKSI